MNTLASLGFMSFNISIVFGTHIFQVVEQMQFIQLGRDKTSREDWEERIFSALANLRQSGQEENLHELKGVLFELLLYPLLRHLYPSAEIWPGRFLSMKKGSEKRGYEYDYIIRSSNPKELIVVEAKGYSGGAFIPKGSAEQKNTLSWFFRNTLPFAQTALEADIKSGYQLRACYITSGNFRADGLTMLEELNSGGLKPSQQDCSYDRHKLLNLFKRLEFTKAAEILKRYYLPAEQANHNNVIMPADPLLDNLLSKPLPFRRRFVCLHSTGKSKTMPLLFAEPSDFITLLVRVKPISSTRKITGNLPASVLRYS